MSAAIAGQPEELEELLARVAALQPEERDADVEAFLQAVDNEREACRMLPLPAPGRPVRVPLPEGGAAREAELRKVRLLTWVAALHWYV